MRGPRGSRARRALSARLQRRPPDRAGLPERPLQPEHAALSDAGPRGRVHRDGARRAYRAARWARPAARRHTPVDGQLARPLGGRHAGGRDDPLHRQDRELRSVHAPRDRDGPDAAPDRAVPARRAGHAPLRVHRRRPGELHAAVHGGGSDEARDFAALRIRVSRGQLRHAEHAVRRPHRGGADVRGRTSRSPRVARGHASREAESCSPRAAPERCSAR